MPPGEPPVRNALDPGHLFNREVVSVRARQSSGNSEHGSKALAKFGRREGEESEETGPYARLLSVACGWAVAVISLC